MLLPNNKQKTRMFQYADAARFAYNWTLAREEENYKNGGKFIYDSSLRKEFTILKHTEEYAWLRDIDCDVTKQAIKDACSAYKRFFKGLTNKPKFKTKKYFKRSFYQDNVKIKFTNTHVRLIFTTGKGGYALTKRSRNFCNVRLAEHNRIPTDCKYRNPRVTYDGINWWISVSIEYSDIEPKNIKFTDGIGIDLGVKYLAICSNENKYPNINKTNKIKKLKKKRRRLQRSIYSKKQKINRKEYCETNNVIKKKKLLLKVEHKMANIRKNYVHQTTSEIINRKPRFICIEDLAVKTMTNNKYLSKLLIEQYLYEFRRQIEYKSQWNNIPVVIADKWFPSSKLCSCCGSIKKNLKLSDRIYKCECGNIIDRDFQAALNLKAYGENILSQNL